MRQRLNGGLPWWSRGNDSTLPLQGAQVQSLVWQLRSHVPCGTEKKKSKRFKWKNEVLELLQELMKKFLKITPA